MKQMKLLVDVLLAPTQKMLLGFQKKNVLDSDTSEGENASDEDDVRMIERIKSDNPLIKISTLGKIKMEVQQYLDTYESFLPVDLRILEGILSKNRRQDNKNTINHSRA